jgi:hypothetical protein
MLVQPLAEHGSLIEKPRTLTPALSLREREFLLPLGEG